MHKFTLVIPTRERADTLYWTLKACLEQTYANYEIIVSDNFSNDNTKQVVESFESPRIRYVNPGKRLSMTSNFEHGLSKVKEGFVCFLGDDDALIPNCLEEVSKLISETKTQAIAWKPAGYIWNSVSDKQIAGKLKLPLTNSYSLLNGKEILKQTERDVYLSIKMPSPYWSFVHIDLINQCFRDGRFFYSFIPDTYAGAMIASVCGNYVYSQRPFSISGSSHHSNALGFFNKKINQESNKTFLEENDLSIHPKMEIGPSAALLLAEPLLQAGDRISGFKLDVYKALNSALWEAKHCGDPEIFTLVTEKIKLAAKKNGLEKRILNVISKTLFVKQTGKTNTKVQTSEEELFLYTSDLNHYGFKLENIYDATHFVAGLLPVESPVEEKNIAIPKSNKLIKRFSELLSR